MLNYINILFLTLGLSIPGYAASASGLTEPQVHEIYTEAAIQQDVPDNTLSSSEAAREIIYSIVHSVGLKPNFEIREADIKNAAAISYKGKRFILYDAKFMKRIQHAAETDWAAVSILAHEIGHHLNGHTMMGKANDKPALELEADEFSGFIMRQMGASLEEAQQAMRVMASEKGSSSHPGKKARLAAIEKGYIAANERILAYAKQPLVHMVASEQPEKEKAVEESAVYALAEDNIFKEVHFRTMPERTFYLTQQLKLVAMTEAGPAELGSLTKKEDKLMLNIYNRKGSASRSFYISEKGLLVDEANNVVGYIKNRT